MKSIKLMLTSVVCLLLSVISLLISIYLGNSIESVVWSGIFLTLLFVTAVFFILGWVIKDKPLIPKNKTEETKTEDK